MTLVQAFILGIIQGITEFLPVSSSGHLVIAQHLFNLSESPATFDVLLHVATLTAVVVFFFPKLIKLTPRQMVIILLGTIPAGIVGVFLNDSIDLLFSSLTSVGIGLLLTGTMLLLTKKLKNTPPTSSPPTPIQALKIGLIQAVAIIPGISRSGSTISAGLFLGLSRTQAFEFSFLLSIPAILGAFVLQLRHVQQLPVSQLLQYSLGFVAALVAGLISLKLLQKSLQSNRFYLFGWYCILLGAVTLIVLH